MTTLSKARLRYLMPIELIKFLKKEKALCAFMNAFVNNCKNHAMTDEKFIIDLLKSPRVLIRSFMWAKYPHKGCGIFYWRKLHDKWQDYQDHLNNK